MQIRSYTRMLTTHLEVEALCQNALSSLLELFGVDGGAVLVEVKGSLKLLGSSGLANGEELGKNAQVLETLSQLARKRIDIPVEAQIDGVVAMFRPQTVLLFPIIYKGLGMGVVILVSKHSISRDVEQNLDLFISSLALALHNAVTHDQIQRLAAVDPLTGVYNRRFGLTRLREEFIRSVKQNTALGVLVLDVDHFKGVNDTYGHTVGDRVLQGIASCARSQLREGDLLIRLGGDEFMVVLLGASGNDVLEVGEAIRRTVSERTTNWGEQQIKVTVSIGGASLAAVDAKDEQDLIEAADKALYQVKESGRNRVGV
jgi:diguanylate cyclase (GGDEF)-like protein